MTKYVTDIIKNRRYFFSYGKEFSKKQYGILVQNSKKYNFKKDKKKVKK